MLKLHSRRDDMTSGALAEGKARERGSILVSMDSGCVHTQSHNDPYAL